MIQNAQKRKRCRGILNSSVIMLVMIFSTGVWSDVPSLEPLPDQINAVRFDPSYYYTNITDVKELCNSLLDKWQSSGVNTVFFKVYDPVYGAKYQTSYRHNRMTDFGRYDLLGQMIDAAADREIKIIAWIPAFLHKQAWEANQGWRVKLAAGVDYRPDPDSYFLCPANPAVQEWWTGFLADLINRYPELDGIDIAEPIISWRGADCFCDACTGRDAQHSIDALSRILAESIRRIKTAGLKACVTTVAATDTDGNLLSSRQVAIQTGFDLDALLSSADRPDWLNLELMWQQWADRYPNAKVFTPDWVRQAGRQLHLRLAAAVRLLAHVELTSFGQSGVDPAQLKESIISARNGGIADIDVYDTHLIDSQNGWHELQKAFTYVKTKKVLVVHDVQGTNDARQIAGLLTHFHAEYRLQALHGEDQWPAATVQNYDAVFYVGVNPGFVPPASFLKAIAGFEGTVCWIHFGMQQLLESIPALAEKISFQGSHDDSLFNQVNFRGVMFTRQDTVYQELVLKNSAAVKIFSTMTDGSREIPYILRAGRYWLVSDLPTAFVVEGGRHIVLSELLHDILEESHRRRHLALVRLEDIHPLTDPQSLQELADRLEREKVPYSVAVVPYYLDPASNTTVALSDEPALVEVLKGMVKSGAALVMHGTTHQYRGETTADYEFWDTIADGPLFGDSEEFVRQRLITGLNEFHRNGLYPLIWETPHYGASQLDYRVINQFFSTSYERRQTTDRHGADQLLPYLIHQHAAGGKIVPENLGYVPLSQPEAGPILDAARKILSIRDGVASFFFHEFVNHQILTQIVSGLKRQGYQFSNPRYINNEVYSPAFSLVSGTGVSKISLEKQYLQTFDLVPEEGMENEVVSDSAMTAALTDTLNLPPGWLKIMTALDHPPPSGFAKFGGFFSSWLDDLIQAEDDSTEILKLAEGVPACPLVIVDNQAIGPAAVSQRNITNALASVGIDYESQAVADLLTIPERFNLIIIPAAAAARLNEQQILFLIRALQNGTNIIFERHSEISRAIGILPREEKIHVDQTTDEYYPQVEIHWQQADTCRLFDLAIDYVTYYSDAGSHESIVTGGEYGKGRYLFFSTYFDPQTGYGYGRFPYFIDLLKRQFNLVPAIRRETAEIYFEAGDREDISIEELVKMWRKNGVEKIYVSGWHFYKNYAYDYQRLINLAHLNAMKVYYWLELPHVTARFWELHPEWREKTATGRDAKIDWRKNMALNIPACRKAVEQFLTDKLLAYDWDGVNLAELYFESPDSYLAPDNFTPFNDYSRQSFRLTHGFDPRELFQPDSKHFWRKSKPSAAIWDSFRKEQIASLHSHFLSFLTTLQAANNRTWEIIVTTIDDVYDSQTAGSIAVNTRDIISLQKQYDFTVQIEDPQKLWAMGPARYDTLSQAYRKLLDQNPPIFDINIVPFRDFQRTMAPTRQPSGLELYSAVNSAAAGKNRVAFYSESSIYEIDFPVISFALASASTEHFERNVWEIQTPYMISMNLNRNQHEKIRVNGDLWPAYHRGHIILPAGTYRIEPVSRWESWKEIFASSTSLVEFSGELLAIESLSRGLWLNYKNEQPVRLVISDQPAEIVFDNQEKEFQVQKGISGYALQLPAGEHEVYFYTQTMGSVVLRQASMLISGLIVAIGVLAVISLLLIYLRSRVWRIFAK